MAHVCSHRHVWTFDNFLRPIIHNPAKIFAPFIKAGMRVMDVGCGAGFATIGIARLVGDEGKVVAVDVQPEMLAKVARRVKRAGLDQRVEISQSASDRLQVEGRFDFVNAFYMVHEVPDTAAFFKQIHARLHPQSQFLVVEPIFHVSRGKFKKMIQVAENNGFIKSGAPAIRASRAVVLTKRKN